MKQIPFSSWNSSSCTTTYILLVLMMMVVHDCYFLTGVVVTTAEETAMSDNDLNNMVSEEDEVTTMDGTTSTSSSRTSQAQSSESSAPAEVIVNKGPRIAVIGGGISGTFVSKYITDYDTMCFIGSLTLFDKGLISTNGEESFKGSSSNPQDGSSSSENDNIHQGSRVMTYKLPDEDGTIVEVGASIVYDGNHLVNQMIEGDTEYLIKTPPMENTPPSKKERTNIEEVPQNNRRKGFAMWNGKEILVNTANMPEDGWKQTDYQLLARYGYDLIKLSNKVKHAVEAFEQIYNYLDSHNVVFESPKELWKSAGLYDAAQVSFDKYLDTIGISRNVGIVRSLLKIVGLRQGSLRYELMTGANLSNYNQDNTELNGLAGLVSFVPTTGKLFSIMGGNERLIKSAWKQASTIHEKHCASVGGNTNTRSRLKHVSQYVSTVVTTDTSMELFASDGTALGEYDIVILAAPLQQSRIQFLKQSHFDNAVLSDLPLNGLIHAHGPDDDDEEDTNNNPQNGGEIFDSHRTPPPLPTSATNQYRQTITTVISHGELQTSYFNFERNETDGSYVVPKSIYMTVEGKNITKISSISEIPSRTIPGVYKMFSSTPLEINDIVPIFGKGVKILHQKVWGGPYGGAYPSFEGAKGTSSQSLPFTLYDGSENLKGRRSNNINDLNSRTNTAAAIEGPALFYTNGMESAVAAIEISAIGAKAVSKLIAQRLGLIDITKTKDTTLAEEL